ncbi:hypothetical protein QYE76_039659 [Lolium multiflorum]|uniref:Reverse transcriptase Ty1/copia-type domain-containing protein n=1 Tax=Lolium multiflorum TaxID=4521 RepID=A0AAD8WU69_LOLMU|nr:hypothetical protein QYE76_039659 [Lolium multiflorum]
MDVTFRESEPFYGEKTDLSSLFDIDFDSPNTGEASREGESEVLRTNEDEPLRVMVDSVPYPMGEERWRKPNEEENLKVYTRRKSQHEQQQQQAPTTSDTQVQGEQHVQQQAPTTSDTHVQGGQHAPTGVETDELSDDAGPSITRDSMDLPIALRKGTRAAARKPPNWYQEEHDIANYVSYASLSTNYRAFIASLQSVVIPRDWKVAKQDPKWREAMIEELNALERNKTWELVHLPAGKRAVGCKWIYTVKQNPEGKIERYKARLVARGYSQTYGIDYDETFASVAKMNTVRILISCATNFGWPLHQLDVKNAFLHGDLKEEVYMDIPPGFSTPRTSGKCNGDHTVFYRHSNSKITILAVYVDDIIITGDDEVEISRLKDSLRKEFEVKDLGQLKYFLGIEIARSPKGIVLSQRKYVLDLLSDTCMLGCRVASTPIDQNHKLCAKSGEPVNKEKYQKLVGRLIYLCHTRPDISYAVSVVSRYMHDPRSGHLDAVNQILRYLKGSPGKGLWFKRNGHLNVDGYFDADWASCLDDRRSTSGYCVFVGGNLVSWRSKKQPVVSKSTAEAEYRAMSQGLSEMLWVRNLLSELKLLRKGPLNLWCDNKSAINIANNPVQHDRTKHVEIDRFFIKEKLDDVRIRTNDEYRSNTGEHSTITGCRRLTWNRPPSMHAIVTVGRTWISPWHTTMSASPSTAAVYGSVEQANALTYTLFYSTRITHASLLSSSLNQVRPNVV